jgi:hypothetical protein
MAQPLNSSTGSNPSIQRTALGGRCTQAFGEGYPHDLGQAARLRAISRSSQYHPEWVIASASRGPYALWVTEWLTTTLDLLPGMRVSDLGRGRAASSIFPRREIGVQVWATDLWFSAAENLSGIALTDRWSD